MGNSLHRPHLHGHHKRRGRHDKHHDSAHQDQEHPHGSAAASATDEQQARVHSPLRDEPRGWSDEHPATSERVAAVQAARAQGGPTPPGGAGVAPPVAGAGGGTRGSGDPEWLSALLKHMWPHVAASVEKMVWQMLPDMLEQSKPTWITKLAIKKFELGDDAPYISNVRAVNGTDPAVPDIHLEADVTWVTDKSDIELDINPLPKFMTSLPGIKQLTTYTVGVEDVSIKARVHISMSPMLYEVPVIGALQISFLEVPDMSWDLTISSAADPLLDAFEPWLMSFVEDMVSSTYVYPGHYFYPLQQGIPDLQSAAGIVEVEVVEANNVPKMDYFQKSSPYCKLWLSGASALSKQTPVQDYTRDPVWTKDNTFGFPVHSPGHQQLVVTLFDSDYGSADDEIGRVHLRLSELRPGQTLDTWLSFGDQEQGSSQQQQGEQGGKKKKRSLGQKALMAVIPTANQQTKQLPNCRLHLRATYHSLAEADVKRLHEAEKAHRPAQLDMIQEPRARQIVQRYGLLGQLTSIKSAQQENSQQQTNQGGSANTAGTSSSGGITAAGGRTMVYPAVTGTTGAVRVAGVPQGQDVLLHRDQVTPGATTKVTPMGGLQSGSIATAPAGVAVGTGLSGSTTPAAARAAGATLQRLQ